MRARGLLSIGLDFVGVIVVQPFDGLSMLGVARAGAGLEQVVGAGHAPQSWSGPAPPP